MDSTQLITVIAFLLLILLIFPSLRAKMLRTSLSNIGFYIMVWAGLIAALVIIYQHFGGAEFWESRYHRPMTIESQ